jgi:endonuclease YncB( thermonuclease family)
MKIKSVKLKISIFLLSFFCVLKVCFAESMTAKVVAVSDGDTIVVLVDSRQHKVRLLGIDAPEKNQPFGNQSKQSLAEMVFSKTVVIDFNKRDKYQRIVGKILLGSVDVNLQQIKFGYAWHYKQYEKEQDVEDRALYANQEYLARKNNIGLWSDSIPTPPWEFRKRRKF